jgi:ApaG protein
MATLTTQEITINVETSFQPKHRFSVAQVLFAYQITIINHSTQPVQLLSRHWFIADSLGMMREVEGEGVVGEKPVLRPGEAYTYMSMCSLDSDMGKMHGTYTMQRLRTQEYFEVQIPEFVMIVPNRLN